MYHRDRGVAVCGLSQIRSGAPQIYLNMSALTANRVTRYSFGCWMRREQDQDGTATKDEAPHPASIKSLVFSMCALEEAPKTIDCTLGNSQT